MPWLVPIPAHWNPTRLGHLGHLSKGNGGTKDDDVPAGIPCIRYGDLYKHHQFFIESAHSFIASDRLEAYTPVLRGDLLFAASGETVVEIGKSAVSLIDEEVCCGGDLLIFRSHTEVNFRFLGYVADCPQSILQKSRMGRGVTIVHVAAGDLKHLRISIPPLSEQAAIVKYLGHANARIDRTIAAKRMLIALLEEQKQAIINQAVTHGLDPDVPMKDPDIPWLTEIPAHWDVEPFLRSIVERADYRGATPEKVGEGVFLVTAKNVRKGWINYHSSQEFVRESDFSKIMRRGLVRMGDLLLTMEAPLGNVAAVDREDIALAQRLVRFRTDHQRLRSTFAVMAMNSSYFQAQFAVRATGSTAQGMKASKLPQLVLSLPPVDEQDRIVAYVATHSSGIDRVCQRTASEIELLREFRTRLTADVVTGQLDVRAAAARLPELDPTELVGALVGLDDDFLDPEAVEHLEEVDA